MIVCEHCLCAIESHEGHQKNEKLIYTDEYNGEEIQKCEWCEEEDLAENMYVI